MTRVNHADASVHIRCAGAADLAVLEALEARADSLLPGSHDPSWPPPTPGAQRAAEPGFVLVAVSGRQGREQVVGFVHVLDLGQDRWHVDQLVMPFNGPFYASEGFVELDPAPHWLDRFVAAEERLGMARWGRRIAMTHRG